MISMKSLENIDPSQYDRLSNREIFSLSQFLYKKNKLFESVSALKFLIKRGYRNTDVRLQLARCYDRISFLLGDIEYEDLARETYEDILRTPLRRLKRRKILKCYNSLINRIYELHENEYNAFRKALQLKVENIKNPKIWMQLGANFNIRKNVDFVINAYQHALDLDPNYILALFRLGYIYQYNKNEEERALNYYTRLVKLHPEEDCNQSETSNARCILAGCNQLGKIYFEKKEYRKVVAVFNHALQIQDEYLAFSSLSSIRNLIYLADISATHINLRGTLDVYMKSRYYLSLNHLLNKYCTRISVA
jgi:tetratricopeptide (TPR) repeat protein